MTSYTGACFCGSIGFDLQSLVAAPDWSIRACQCAFCRAHDALSSSDPAGELQFHCSRPENLQRYRFAMRTADFLLCRECGVYIGAVMERQSDRYGIINTHSLRAPPLDIAPATAISYDSEERQERVDRRASRWTPVTAVPW